MILCVGALGSGKSTLLKLLQQYGQENEVTLVKEREKEGAAKPAANTSTSFESCKTPVTTPTMGTDLLTLYQADKSKVSRGQEEDHAYIREVGGAMAPIWSSSVVESGKTKAVLYVVDSSSPENIGASTVHLVELLSHPALEGLKVMIVFSKADRKAARHEHELKNLMRLDEIIAGGNHDVKEMTFNYKNEEHIKEVFDWCMQFKVFVKEIPVYDFPLA